jgi:protein-S-isoprenylcysteine O-methyltransferase Ste14
MGGQMSLRYEGEFITSTAASYRTGMVSMFRSAFVLVAQLLPGVVLVLYGWGFDELSAFFINPVRAGLAVVTFAAAVGAAVWGVELHPMRRGSMPVGKQSLQLGILLLVSLFLLWFLPFADRRKILTFQQRHWQNYWRYAGLLLCCVGIMTRVLALKALGKYFSAYVTLQPNHRLVQEGIYRRIRHPLYLSLLLAPTGIALVFDSWLALPILVLSAIFVFDRIPREERLLAAHFGREFEEYRLRTWKLIPYVL